MATKRVLLKNKQNDYLIPYVDQVGNLNSASTDPIKFWRGTQAQYDALESKDANTLYITGDMEATINGVTFIELVEA